jgi:hypothetical protein
MTAKPACPAGKLRAERGRQPEAHRAQSTGVEPQARLVEPDQLRAPHLVLSHVGANDGLAARETVDLGHQMLRPDHVGLGPAIVGMFRFPLVICSRHVRRESSFAAPR